MKLVRPLSLALALFSVSAPSWAAQHDQHKAHHPAGSASTTATKPVSAKASSDRAQMVSQTKAMQAMHDKMMAAKTPEERSALMAEHMKSMQEGMDMMKGIRHGRHGWHGRPQEPSDQHDRAPDHDGAAHGHDADHDGDDGRSSSADGCQALSGDVMNHPHDISATPASNYGFHCVLQPQTFAQGVDRKSVV